MEKAQLTKFLSEESLDSISGIHTFPIIDSTNAEAERLIGNGIQGVQLIIADSQSAGQGRRGRSWFSPRASGLYLSLVCPFSLEEDSLQGLSLVTALSVHSVLQKLTTENLQLKWPNDILIGDKKLSGILLKARNDSKKTWIVFGIGVNYWLSAEHRLAIDRPVTDIREIMSETPSLEQLAAQIINRLLENIGIFIDSGFKTFQTIWNRYDRYQGKEIVVLNGNSSMKGFCQGVDESGSLLLQTARDIQKISGGEIFPSLRATSELSKE